MRIRSVIAAVGIGICIFAAGCGPDAANAQTPFFTAFKTLCVDTHLELPALHAALHAAQAKEIPELHYSDPTAIQSQLRVWKVRVAGQDFEASIRTFDIEFSGGVKTRTMSCTVQSFGKTETAGIAEIHAWLGVAPKKSWSDETGTTQMFSYGEIDGRRIAIHFDRPTLSYRGRIWDVELTQFNGIHTKKLDLDRVATAEISTRDFSNKSFPMNF